MTETPPKKYWVWTVGCQMNKVDSERVATVLESQGVCPRAARTKPIL